LNRAAGRYARQVALWGAEAQERLASSSVLVAGLGGLGSAAALYLAAAGVGRLVLVDDDRVEESDLNRQVLHWTPDVGRPKVESAAEKLARVNPEVEVVALSERIDSLERALELVERVDVVLDCLDNWATRLLLNDACAAARKPLVHAAVEGMAGWLTVVKVPEGPCLRCALPRALRDRQGVPVVGPLPGVLGSMQAVEALKLLTGYGRAAVGVLVHYDAASCTFETIPIERNPRCPTCGVKR